MSFITTGTENRTEFGMTTKLLAGLCHQCGVCPYANRKPESRFGRLMEWHRTWCPAWAAHTKVYGLKDLSA
jgi:hypothetical protein